MTAFARLLDNPNVVIAGVLTMRVRVPLYDHLLHKQIEQRQAWTAELRLEFDRQDGWVGRERLVAKIEQDVGLVKRQVDARDLRRRLRLRWGPLR